MGVTIGSRIRFLPSSYATLYFLLGREARSNDDTTLRQKGAEEAAAE